MKRILSTTITLLILCMSMISFACAAGTNLTYDLSVEGSNSVTVSTGDTITVTYAIHSDAGYRVNAIQNEIKFDDSFFQLVDDSIKTNVGAGTDQVKKDGPRVYMNDVDRDYSADQTVGTFQLKVIAKSGSSTVESTDCMAFEGSGQAMQISTKNLTVSIKGGGDKPPVTETIDVTFRLIGAEKAKQDVDLSKSDYLPKYVTWIKTTAFEVDKGAKVYDVFMEALNQAGLDQTGADNNYVSSITAPEVLGGYKLAEFTNGSRSGWMYTINGKHPNKGLTQQGLKDGDVIVWHYVNDYLYEVDDWHGGGNGDESTWNKWLEAKDVNPTAATKPEEKPDDPGVIIEPEVTVKGDTATATVTDKQITAAIDSAKDSGEKTITIAPTGTDKAKEVMVELPKSAAQSIVKDTDAALNLETDKGTVTIPNDTLKAINEQATGSSIQIIVAEKSTSDVTDKTISTENATIVEVTVKSGNKIITSFGGKSLTISIPAGSKHVEGQSYKVVAISSDGKTEMLIGKCVKVGGKLVVQVDTTHLTTFVATTEKVMPFTDVKESNYYYDAVLWAVAKGITNGTTATTFSPNAACTRAQMVTFLWRAAGSPEPTGKTNAFTDVKTDAYYFKALLWAIENGITNGTTATTFSPNATCTRGQMAAFLYRNAKSPAVSGNASFTDVKDSDYYSSAVIWAAQEGITNGTTAATFSPNAACTRAQMVTFLYRYLAD